MRIQCPHCRSSFDTAGGADLSTVSCPSCGSEIDFAQGIAATVSYHPKPPAKVGHFELLGKLGAGSFGVVWKARDTRLDRIVALKIARHADVDAAETGFLREARAAAQLRHPNIVSVHEVGQQGDIVYIVTDFVDGVTLGQWSSRKRPAPREAAQLCVKLADALDHAHEAGVIHRDLKPSNIMMDKDGEPHITDFGLAKRETAESTGTAEGQVLGTPAYMSPEQARGEARRVDRRTDVYSLGVVLFELLAGVRPFQGSGPVLIEQVLSKDAPSPRRYNADVPRELEVICLRCLEKTPEHRFSTAAEIAAELRRFLEGEPIRSRPIGAGRRAWRWCRRNPVVAGLSAALGIVVLAAVVLITARDWKSREPKLPADVREVDAAKITARDRQGRERELAGDVREADAGKWLHDEYFQLRVHAVKGTLMHDGMYDVNLEVANRTDQAVEIPQIVLEAYNAEAASRLGSKDALTHVHTWQEAPGQPLRVDPGRRQWITMSVGQALPDEIVVKVFRLFSDEPSEFRVHHVGEEVPMPAPRRLPRDAIYQGLDGLAVLQQVAAKALAWAEDAALCTMFPMDQRAELEPDTGLEIVRVSAWVIRFVSPARGTSRAYRVTADAVEELETSADVPDCRPIGMPRIGNHEALDLASRNLLVCGNWNASRIEQVRPDMKAPRLRQMQVDGQWTFVWYLPYLGPDAVPIIVDALTGDRVRMADGAFKRFRWEVE